MAECGDSTNLAEWMGNLPEEVKNRPLNRLAVPGTHDSFTFSLRKDGPVAPSAPPAIKKLAAGLGPLIKPTVLRWSATQDWNVHQQLSMGIRYFDVRVSPMDQGMHRKYYFVHGLYGQELSLLLQEINQFLEKHHEEIVFIDFNHFYEMGAADHKALQAVIKNIFRHKISTKKPLTELTIKKLTDAYQQVLIFYHDESAKSSPECWEGTMIPSPWPNVTCPGKLVEILEANYNRGKPVDKFHVTQGILTPSSDYLLKYSLKSLKSTLCAKAAGPFVEWLKQKSPGRHKGINICVMDYAEMADYITTVVALNLKQEEAE